MGGYGLSGCRNYSISLFLSHNPPFFFMFFMGGVCFLWKVYIWAFPGFGVMDIITILIEVVIFTALIGTIASQVANPDGNVTGTSLVLYGLITLFVVIGFIVALMKTLGLKKGR